MKIAVIDANYSKNRYWGLAATWLRWELERAGVTETAPELAEFLLVTVSSQQGASKVRGTLRRLGNKQARVIVGGGGAYGPAVFDGLADCICVGEGARFIHTMLPLSRRVTKSVRIGVEGPSERLRRAVGKPVANVDLLNATFCLLANGIGVRWFFIVGLPGETVADYEDLRFLVSELKKLPKGCVMMNFHAFIPQPATPLSVLPLRDDYWERFDEFRRWFFHGPGFTRRVQIVAPAQHAGRLKRSQESMAATETELRRGWWQHDNANWRVSYNATPASMRRIARVYATKTGL